MSPGCKVQFIKKIRKESVIRFLRSDGTVTWRKIHPGTEDHDLAHYAVESELRLQRAFYGLLNAGIEIADFELPANLKPDLLWRDNMPYDAQVAEFIVNLLQTDRWNSDIGKDFISQLRQILEQRDITYPEDLTEDRLEKIRHVYTDLMARWNLTPEDSSLQLDIHWLDAE